MNNTIIRPQSTTWNAIGSQSLKGEQKQHFDDRNSVKLSRRRLIIK